MHSLGCHCATRLVLVSCTCFGFQTAFSSRPRSHHIVVRACEHGNEILRNRETLNEILASHCGQPIKRIAKDTDRDFFLSAEEAKEYGVVDDILAKPPVEVDEDEAAK